MSRLYAMKIYVEEFDQDKRDSIQDAVIDLSIHCDCDGSCCDYIECDGQFELYPGVYEERFVDRLSMTIWTANGGYCHVQVKATDLDDLPYENHFRNQTDFARLVKSED